MTIEKAVCDLVRLHWRELHPVAPPPESLVFLKVAGKGSPNAAIVALVLDGRLRRPVAVAKIPRNPRSAPGIERECAAMEELGRSLAGDPLLAAIPWRVTAVEVDGARLLLQIAAPGHPMVRELISRRSVLRLYSRILPWMIDFHGRDAEQASIEGSVARELVAEPVARFLRELAGPERELLSVPALEALASLPDRVERRNVRLCRQHGDFNAHNMLVERRWGRLRSFSLIDWEDYQPRQLPVHDLNHFFTSNSKVIGSDRSGDSSYAALVLGDGWYRDLLLQAVAAYEARGLIDRETFFDLTPIYHMGMVLRISEVQRRQEHTRATWLRRLNAFLLHRLGRRP